MKIAEHLCSPIGDKKRVKVKGGKIKDIRYLPVLKKRAELEKKPSLIIPSYFILKSEHMRVEEELLGFAFEHSDDYLLYRTEKPRMKERGTTFGKIDSSSVYEKLKTTEKYNDRFVVMIHRHPGECISPSLTDNETFSLLKELYDMICGIIINEGNTKMNVFCLEGFDRLNIQGGGLKRGEKDGYWKIG